MIKQLILAGMMASLILGCAENKKEDNKAPEIKIEQNTQIEKETASVEKQVEEKIQKEQTTEAKLEEKIEDKETKEKVVEEKVATTEVSGEALFKTCASCHGTKGEKKALGKSQVITGWDKQRTLDSLNGYKDGTYGGVMKGIMKPHVDNKTPEELEALADFISKLN